MTDNPHDRPGGTKERLIRRSVPPRLLRPSNSLIGIGLMVIAGLNFVAVTAIVKHVGTDLPPAEAAFLRYLLGLAFVIPMLKPMLAARIGKRDLALFGVRGAFHTVAVICWFYAMTQITIAEVTAMNYLVPVYITIGAALFLGERLEWGRAAAVAAALAGTLVILRPGLREVTPGHAAMIVTALGFAASYLFAKRLSDNMSAAVIVGMLSVCVTIGLAPFAVAVWVAPTASQLLWMFLVAFFATAAHYSMTLAFRYAEISTVQPATFLQLVWATLLGALAFGEPADIWVIVGGAVIIAAASLATLREAAVARR